MGDPTVYITKNLLTLLIAFSLQTSTSIPENIILLIIFGWKSAVFKRIPRDRLSGYNVFKLITKPLVSKNRLSIDDEFLMLTLNACDHSHYARHRALGHTDV